VAVVTTVLAFVVLGQARNHDAVHWFGGWLPTSGHALGVAFTANALDAATACGIGVLSVAALTFAIRYFEEAGHLFQVLMLVFLGGLLGFTVTGDLFNLFVFFELMTVSAYALCGYRIERPSALQGALNFAILNSIGAFFVLMGITLVYARTGALNLAQVGESLGRHPADGTVGIAFAAITVGFLVKAGAVPFHFWLSDAYAVAAAPAGALFAGVMSDLGYHALARVWWTCFSGSFGPAGASVRTVLLAVGVVTAVLGAVMCFLQGDIKRQLAYLVISHGGIALCGVALLTAWGVAATTAFVVADGFLKGALFLGLGLTVGHLRSSDELALHGRGRRREVAAVGGVLVVATLLMAPLPGFATWRAAAMMRIAADAAGYSWLPALLAATTAVTAGALLRAYIRIYLGWGPAEDRTLQPQPDRESGGEGEETSRPGRWLVGAPILLVAAGVAVGFVPHLGQHAVSAAKEFVDQRGYADEVLRGVVPTPPSAPTVGVSVHEWLTGAATLVGALVVAALGLWGAVLPGAVRRAAGSAAPAVRALRRMHSGAVGDHVVWLTAGAAALCVAAAVTVR
jgi:multicomponent Na+:H+ antiporter subunit D